MVQQPLRPDFERRFWRTVALLGATLTLEIGLAAALALLLARAIF
jgi:hypothetical protein